MSSSEKDDLNHACVIRFLQIRGKIEEDLPSQKAPSELCRILLPLIYANHSERLCVMLWDTKTIKADCVIENLKKNDFIDLQLKYEVYENLKNQSKIEKKRKLEEISRAKRDALINAADVCKSDFSYGGMFDEILGMDRNLKALQREYCLLKYVLDNNFLFMRHVNLNPKRIDTKHLECMPIVVQCQDDAEEKLMRALRARDYSADAINCIIERYRDERIFGWNIAKDFVRKVSGSEEARRSEDFRISKKLSDFGKGASNCIYSFNWSLFLF